MPIHIYKTTKSHYIKLANISFSWSGLFSFYDETLLSKKFFFFSGRWACYKEKVDWIEKAASIRRDF